MATEQRLNTIVINKVENKAVYDNMLSRGFVKDDEFYLVDDSEEIKVKSVNGNTPNADGDVTLTASDVGASASDHNHDDRYYTESETNALLNNKANSSDLDNYLLKSGGTMSGGIIHTSELTSRRDVDNASLGLLGGTSWAKGASFYLSGKDQTGNEGIFSIYAHDGTNYTMLRGTPNGSLTWGNKHILRTDYVYSTSHVVVEGGGAVIYNKDTRFTRGTTPPNTIYRWGLLLQDKDGNNMGGVYETYYTDKKNIISLHAYTGADTSSTNNNIGIGYDGNGKIFTQAPTPATADNSNQIATTAYVKNNLSNYAETNALVTGIDALKTLFYNTPIRQTKSGAYNNINFGSVATWGVFYATRYSDTNGAIVLIGNSASWGTMIARYTEGAWTYRKVSEVVI